jgi:hypothetical protein
VAKELKNEMMIRWLTVSASDLGSWIRLHFLVDPEMSRRPMMPHQDIRRNRGKSCAQRGHTSRIYYGPKRAVQTYYWWWEVIYDDKVLREVEKKILSHRLGFANWKGGETRYVQVAHSVNGIAARLKRNPRFVAWALRRLERRRKVVRAIDGWYAKD